MNSPIVRIVFLLLENDSQRLELRCGLFPVIFSVVSSCNSCCREDVERTFHYEATKHTCTSFVCRLGCSLARGQPQSRVTQLHFSRLSISGAHYPRVPATMHHATLGGDSDCIDRVIRYDEETAQSRAIRQDQGRTGS